MTEFKVNIEKFDRFAVIRSHGYINNLGGEEIARECRRYHERRNDRIDPESCRNQPL